MAKARGKIVVAFGGNALQDGKGPATAEAQLEVVKKTCEYIVGLVEREYEIAVVHGNGPQVGRLLLASEAAKDITPVLPFDVLGAMSQGYIGYHIQQGLREVLRAKIRDIPVVTLITQVIVDKDDPAFNNPTKPIGSFHTEEEAKALMAEKGYLMKEDAGRGWRHVVPSPRPQRILEIDTVKRLWDSTIVITAGGGGIPVIEREDGTLEGIDAVIDKDFAAELLAEQLDADILIILTEVEKVSLNYNKPNQTDLQEITAEMAEKYIEEGHFAAGSMLPKVQAGVKFVKNKKNRKTIITSLYKVIDALDGTTGTTIIA
ncbi:MAG: carbamate kinase [Firmicutes bacterium HGW-Firmicutes-11]|jgi:carbamate kinase|nr:MAG: carbamate kinase [Firmicutes bacterium HGW-Firmicutes-11]